MLEVVNPTYSKFENEMYTVTCHYSPHVIISKESLDFFLLIKKIIQLQFVILNFLFLFQVQDRESGCRHCSHTEKFRSENSTLWGFTFGWTFFMSHPAENCYPVSTSPYLKTIQIQMKRVSLYAMNLASARVIEIRFFATLCQPRNTPSMRGF